MRKLALSIDSLKVESFETSEERAEGRGTVHGAIRPAPMISDGLVNCIETRYTGSCCDITLALSCVQTNCDDCIVLLTADTCPA